MSHLHAYGVQLHGAHGTYFLSSLLSPYMNRRTDEYGVPSRTERESSERSSHARNKHDKELYREKQFRINSRVEENLVD